MPAHSLPPPDEQQIETLLRAIRPRPGDRFYRHMASAPWRKPAWSWRRPRMLSLGLAVLVVIIVGAITSPRLYALGEQLWRFFLSEPDNRLVITLNTPGVIGPNQLSSPQDFPLSLQDAQQQAGFLLKVLPDEESLALSGMRYEAVTGAIRSLYQADDYNLYLTQRPLKGIQEQAAVGPAAAVEMVTVAGQPGEYVAGGWRLPPGTAAAPAEPAQMDVLWDASLPQRTLRWQDGEYVYELLALGASAPQKQALIALAERVK